jgi:hypothetical protein
MTAAEAALRMFRRLKEKDGIAATYTRGADSLPLTVVAGRTVFASNMDGAARVEFGEIDLLIETADLTLGEPARGDRIAVTLDGTAVTLELFHRSGEPPWRYSNPYRSVIRLHAKRVA